uniref:Uncharacterized protein n=1 Tax=Rhizophora mucronata TaxID=61149 RepID=A0A2P2NS74_RHIMU
MWGKGPISLNTCSHQLKHWLYLIIWYCNTKI